MSTEKNGPDITVDTARFKREGKVEVDGMVWFVRLPGSKTEMRISKADRRIKLLDQKIENGTATEADYDKYDELEDFYYDFFRGLFKDGTKNNSQVNKWVDETPLHIIAATFSSLMKQAERQDD